jgi:hypothetical protein
MLEAFTAEFFHGLDRASSGLAKNVNIPVRGNYPIFFDCVEIECVQRNIHRLPDMRPGIFSGRPHIKYDHVGLPGQELLKFKRRYGIHWEQYTGI